MSIDETIKTSLYMPRSILKRLKDRAFEERRSVNDVIATAVDQWLNAAANSEQKGTQSDTLNKNRGNPDGNVLMSDNVEGEKPAPIPLPQEFQEFEPWLSYLHYILQKDHPKASVAIKSNLLAFVELSASGGGNAPPPPNPDPDEPDAGKTIADIHRRTKDVEAATEKLKRRRGPGRKSA